MVRDKKKKSPRIRFRGIRTRVSVKLSEARVI